MPQQVWKNKDSSSIGIKFNVLFAIIFVWLNGQIVCVDPSFMNAESQTLNCFVVLDEKFTSFNETAKFINISLSMYRS